MAEGAAAAKRSYLFTALSPSVHFIANVETKLKGKSLSVMRKHASRAGFRSFANPAIDTCKDGTSAGEWVLVKKNLTISGHSCIGPHWRGVFLRCVKRDILVVTVYLENGQGPGSEENSRRLASLAAFLCSIKTPWIAIGDWNASPAQLRSTVFIEAVKGVIVVPQNVQFTCWGEGKPSLLDYAVCSRSLHGVVSLQADLEGVWATHYGLFVNIELTPEVHLVRTLTKGFQIKETYQGPCRASWDKLKEIAIAKSPKKHEQTAETADYPQSCESKQKGLTERFSVWSKAAGLAIGDRAGAWGTKEEPQLLRKGQVISFQ